MVVNNKSPSRCYTHCSPSHQVFFIGIVRKFFKASTTMGMTLMFSCMTKVHIKPPAWAVFVVVSFLFSATSSSLRYALIACLIKHEYLYK